MSVGSTDRVVGSVRPQRRPTRSARPRVEVVDTCNCRWRGPGPDREVQSEPGGEPGVVQVFQEGVVCPLDSRPRARWEEQRSPLSQVGLARRTFVPGPPVQAHNARTSRRGVPRCSRLRSWDMQGTDPGGEPKGPAGCWRCPFGVGERAPSGPETDAGRRARGACPPLWPGQGGRPAPVGGPAVSHR